MFSKIQMLVLYSSVTLKDCSTYFLVAVSHWLINIPSGSSLCPHHGNSQNVTIRSTVQSQCLFYEVRTEEAGKSVCLCLMTLIVLSFFPQCTSFQPIRWQSKGHLVKAESVWIRSSTRILPPQTPSETLTSTAITPTSPSTAGRVRNSLISPQTHLKTLSDVCWCIYVCRRSQSGWLQAAVGTCDDPAWRPFPSVLHPQNQETRHRLCPIRQEVHVHLKIIWWWTPLHEFTLAYNKQSEGLCLCGVLSEGRAPGSELWPEPRVLFIRWIAWWKKLFLCLAVLVIGAL